MKRSIQILSLLLLFSVLICACSAPASDSAGDGGFVSQTGIDESKTQNIFWFYRPSEDFHRACPQAAWNRLSLTGMEPDEYINSETGEVSQEELICQIDALFFDGTDLYFLKKGEIYQDSGNPVYELWVYHMDDGTEERLFSAEDACGVLNITDADRPTQATNMDIGPDGVNVNTPMRLFGIYESRLFFIVGYEPRLCEYNLKTKAFQELYVFEGVDTYSENVDPVYRDGCLYFTETSSAGQIRILYYNIKSGQVQPMGETSQDYYPFVYEDRLGTMRFDVEMPDGMSHAVVEGTELFEIPTALFGKISGSETDAALLINLTEKALLEADETMGLNGSDHIPRGDVIAARGIALFKDGAFVPLISDRGRAAFTDVETDGTIVYWSIGNGPLYIGRTGPAPVCFYDGTQDRIITVEDLGTGGDRWIMKASDRYLAVALNGSIFVVDREDMKQ